jgi:hypothetical protein
MLIFAMLSDKTSTGGIHGGGSSVRDAHGAHEGIGNP